MNTSATAAGGHAPFLLDGISRRPSGGIVFVLAALVVLIGTYPGSQVLFILLSYENRASFLAICLLLVLLSLLVWPRNASEPGRRSNAFTWLLFVLAGFMAIKIALHQSPVAIREFAVLVCVIVLLRCDRTALRRIMGRATTITAFLLLISLVALVFSYYLRLVDPAPWLVNKLGELSASNPIVERSEVEEFLFPFYLAAVPLYANDEIAFGIHFIRQPLIFTEWSYTWYAVGAFFLAAIGHRRSGLSVAALAVIGIALVISFSVWGLLVMTFAVVLATFGGVIRSTWILALLLAASAAGAYLYLGIEGILELIGGNKLEQWQYFSAAALTGLITPWGDPEFGRDVHEIYGVINHIFTYGVLGIALYIAVMLYGIIVSFNVFSKPGRFARDTVWTAAAACFVALASLKLTYFVSMFHLLFAGYLCALVDRDNRARGLLNKLPQRRPDLWPV